MHFVGCNAYSNDAMAYLHWKLGFRSSQSYKSTPWKHNSSHILILDELNRVMQYAGSTVSLCTHGRLAS